MNIPIIDYPKIKCPFVRKTINDHYVVTPEIEPGYEWVFEDEGVKAVDKLHGTNICVYFKNGIVTCVDNRKTRLMLNPFISLYTPKHTARIIKGICNSIEKKWIPDTETGRVYGELIAPEINGNTHDVDRPFFVPFDQLSSSCHWKSWIDNKYPKTFESISKWFRTLPSLFSKKYMKKYVLAEGLIFLHHDGRQAKLRRDMFDWYYGLDNDKELFYEQ